MAVRSNVTLKKNFSTRETRRFRRTIRDTTTRGLVAVPRYFLRFSRGVFALARTAPPPRAAATFFQQRALKFLSRRGDDVRDGEAPLFTASASPFLSLAHNNPASSSSNPHQPVGFAFRTEKRTATRGGARMVVKKKKG